MAMAASRPMADRTKTEAPADGRWTGCGPWELGAGKVPLSCLASAAMRFSAEHPFEVPPPGASSPS